MKFIFPTLLIIAALQPSIRSYSFLANECQYDLSNGLNIDISGLRKPQDYKLTQGAFTYYANFCGSLNRDCNGREIPAAVYSYGEHFDQTCIMPLADSFKIDADFMDKDNKSKGLKLDVPEGGVCNMNRDRFYKVTYHLMCDLAVEGVFNNVVKADDCTYEFYFLSKYGCYSTYYKNQSYLTTYVINVMILSCILGAYCIGYMMFNYRKNPEDGLVKALPHRSFWTNWISKGSDSLDWLYQVVRRKNNKSGLDNY
jgi:hypothetical protein